MAEEDSAGVRRFVWVDIMRGFAVCNVVVFHVHGRIVEYYGSYSEVFGIGVGAGSPVRMPAFMFLSGLLLSGSIKRGFRQYIDAKIRRIAYPFLVWSVITVVVLVSAQSFTGTPHSLLSLLDIFHQPPAGLWFLQYLFVYYMIALLFKHMPSGAFLSATLVLALVLSIEEGLYPFAWFFYLFSFFVVGDFFGDRIPTLVRLTNSRLVMLAGWACVFAFFLVAALGGAGRAWVLTFPFALGGLLVLAQVGRHIEGSAAGAVLAFLGRNALEIYVVHMLIIAFLVAVLRPFLDSQPALLASVTIALTMLISLVPIWLRARVPEIDLLFSLPVQVIPGARPQSASEQERRAASEDDAAT